MKHFKYVVIFFSNFWMLVSEQISNAFDLVSQNKPVKILK